MQMKAIDKLDKEIEKWKDKIYVNVIGEFLIQQVTAHPEYAANILAKEKTLPGALKAVEDVARKNQKNGCGYVSDAEAFTIILEYYGIKNTETNQTPAPAQAASEAKQSVAKSAPALSLDIDDLLG